MASSLFSRRECVVFVAAKKEDEEETKDKQKSKERESSLFVAAENEVAKIKTLEEGQRLKKAWLPSAFLQPVASEETQRKRGPSYSSSQLPPSTSNTPSSCSDDSDDEREKEEEEEEKKKKKKTVVDEEEKSFCVCGRLQSNHSSAALEEASPSMTAWKPEICTKLLPTNTSGALRFSDNDTALQQRRFLRLALPNDFDGIDGGMLMQNLSVWLTERWGMKPPTLVLSVKGPMEDPMTSANLFNLTESIEEQLHQLLHSLLEKNSNVWIVTTGLWDTIGDVVGKTIKDFNLTSVECHRPEEGGVQLIGIAPWGLAHQEGMVNQSENDTVFYHGASSTLGSSKHRLLNPNFSHFLLVDDGTVGGAIDMGHTRKFHARFEETLVTSTEIPLVTLLINGGCGSLKAVERNLTDGIPVVVVGGSGGAADLVADVLTEAEMQKSRAGSSRSYSELRRSGEGDAFYKSSCGVVRDEVATVLEKIGDKESLVSFVNLLQDPIKDSLQQIFTVALSTLEEGSNRVLELALKLDSLHAVADKSAFSCLSNELQVKKLGFEALMKQKISFFTSVMNPWQIRHLVDTRKFIRLFTSLSKDNDRGYSCRALLETGHEMNRWCQDASDGEKIRYIQHMMKIWIGDFYEHETKEPLGRICDPQQRCHSFHSVEDLFLWSVLTCNKPFTLHFLKMLSFPMSGALVAFTILQRYIAADPSSRMVPAFQKEAAYFEAIACDFLTACFESCCVRTSFLLLQEVPAFGRTSLLQLALHSNSLDFMSHPACQRLLDQVWYQGVSPKNGFLSLSLAFFLPRALVKKLLKFQTCSAHRDFEPLTNASSDGSSNHFLRKKIRNLSKVGIDVGIDDASPSKQKLRKYRNSPYVKFQNLLFTYVVCLSIWIVKFVYSDTIFQSFFSSCNTTFGGSTGSNLIKVISDCRPFDAASKYIIVILSIFLVCVYYLFFFSFIANELHQLFIDGPLNHWRKSLWNIVDFVIILAFFVGLVCSLGFFQSDDVLELSFIICFSLLSSRILQMFGAYPNLGTRVSIMKAMISDLWIFFAILAVFAIPYGITCFALIEKKEGTFQGEDGFYKHINILARPYKNMFNKEVFTNKTAFPQNTSRFRREILFPALQAFYVIISNLLLMKILIAMLNFTFKEVQEKSRKIWCFDRHELIFEYYHASTCFQLDRVFSWTKNLLLQMRPFKGARTAKCTRIVANDFISFKIVFSEFDNLGEDRSWGSRYQKMLKKWSKLLSRNFFEGQKA